MASGLHLRLQGACGLLLEAGCYATPSSQYAAPALPPAACSRAASGRASGRSSACSDALTHSNGFSPSLPSRRRQVVCMATEEAAELAEEIEMETEERMDKSITSVLHNFNSVRTGRASSSLLDRVEVQYYGAATALKSLAQVSTPDASTILVTPFDKSTIQIIEKAIMQSDLGITPANDGRVIRLNIPPLTEERRKELTKVVSKMSEEGKVAVRNVRRDAIAEYRKLEKDGKIGEDNLRDYTDNVQKLTDKYVAKIDTMLKAKEKELTTV